ncbi:MAG: cupredoxin domain-containing protein [Minisyncoccia bacterium]|jgi:heme/copper-type cytochrome/quinol oxidase subunit 2
MDERKKIIIEIVIAVVVLAAVAALVVYALRGSGAGPVPGSGQTQTANGNSGVAAAPTSSTMAPVPANTVIPNKGATSTPANVAVPVVQGPGNPGGSVSYRSFNIKIAGGAYSPNTVAVKQGDTVNIEMTAVDANYGFTQPNYGFSGVIPKGKTQTIQFEALQAGDFTFYCASCGGPAKGPVGHLIVTAD